MSKLRFFESKRRRTQSPRKCRPLSVQPLEARRVLAASLGWDGPGLGSAELTYHIANTPDSLTQAETNAAIETALNVWASVADITFTPTSQSGLRDSIEISFTSIDGVGGTLAQAYFPDDVNPARIAGDIQFDISDAWEVGNSLGNRAFDLVYVAVHEIGHSLGLDHTSLFGSLLAPFVSPNQSFSSLASVDVTAIQALYAAVDGGTTTETPVDETPTDETPTSETPTAPGDTDDTTEDTGDTDNDPFPRRRWHRGGNWRRWGGRLDAEAPEYNYVNPTDVNSDGGTSALDALMIINQLSRSNLASGEDVAGLCDTNGDGTITALDALTVINALGRDSASASITVVDDTTDVTDAADDVSETVDDTVDDTETPVNEGGDTVAPIDDTTDTTEVVDDAVDPVDEVDNTETPVSEVDDTTDVVDDTVDPVDEVDDTTDVVDDTTDPVDEVDETDTTDETEDTIDAGGLVDDGDDGTDCRTGGHHHGGSFNVGDFVKDPSSLITRFDTNDDGALSQDEVSVRLWTKLTELEVDADGDGLVTLAELEMAATIARQEAFNAKDTDGDGLLVESEVTARFWAKISAADTDADGGVSFGELDALIAEQQANQSDTEPTVNGDRSNHHHRGHHKSSDAVFTAIGRAVRRR